MKNTEQKIFQLNDQGVSQQANQEVEQLLITDKLQNLEPAEVNRLYLQQVKVGNLNEVKYLVEICNADIHTKNTMRENALHIAASKVNNDVMDYLIEKGVDSKEATIKGQSYKYFAAMTGHMQWFEKCLGNTKNTTEITLLGTQVGRSIFEKYSCGEGHNTGMPRLPESYYKILKKLYDVGGYLWLEDELAFDSISYVRDCDTGTVQTLGDTHECD